MITHINANDNMKMEKKCREIRKEVVILYKNVNVALVARGEQGSGKERGLYQWRILV